MRALSVLAVPGSLRKASYNRALLAAAAECAPAGVVFSHVGLAGVPLFDEDREALDAGGPEVERLRAAVARADALLVSTPEYNQSLPGVLKNAIDWLSRGTPERVLDGKPVAVIGATAGPWGTRYAQQTLRHVLTATGCVVMGSPMLFLREAAAAFDGATLTDETARAELADVVAALRSWTLAWRPMY